MIRTNGCVQTECYNSRMLPYSRARSAPVCGVHAQSAKASWLSLLVILTVLACSSLFAQTSSQDPDRLKQDAVYAMRFEDFDKAIVSYQEWLRLQPNSLTAKIGLAQAYRGVHNYDEARRILEEAHRQHPRNAEPLATLGDLDIEMQTYDEAIRYLTNALSLRPSDVNTRDRLAVAYKAKGDIPHALAQITKVLARDPENALAYYTRAQIESDRSRDAQALPDAEKVVELQPENPLGRVLLGKTLLRTPQGAAPADITKRCSRAVQILEPLLTKQPNDSETLYLLSRAYECAGQADKAKQTLASFEEASQAERTTKENQTQAKHMVEQANALAMKNDFQGTLDLLQQALAKDPDYGPAYSQLAKIYYSAGDMPKASETISQALQRDPYQPDFLYVQGKILEKEGKLDDALASFERTTLVNPKESDAYYEMGVIYQQRYDRPHALAAYKKAAELSPDDPDYQRALAALSASHAPLP